jgi:hypothetical protein
MTDLNDILILFLSENNKKVIGQAVVDIQDQDLYKNNIFKY